jgi:hypothetical protein
MKSPPQRHTVRRCCLQLPSLVLIAVISGIWNRTEYFKPVERNILFVLPGLSLTKEDADNRDIADVVSVNAVAKRETMGSPMNFVDEIPYVIPKPARLLTTRGRADVVNLYLLSEHDG